MKLASTLLCIALTTLLAACGSSPQNNYFRLTSTVTSLPEGETPSLGIGPIEIPAYLDREKLVYAQQGNRLQVSATEYWAEPLDAGIERVLALNLAALLNTQSVRTFPWHPRRAPTYAVKLNLLSLDADDMTARLTAEWLVYRPENSATVERRIARVQQALDANDRGPDALPAAYSNLLYQLSEIIATAIRADVGADESVSDS